VTLFNVTPIASIEHVGHDAVPDSENLVYLRDRGGLTKTPDCSRDLVRDRRSFVSRPARVCPVGFSVSTISPVRIPSKIRGSIVRPIPVVMAHLMGARRGGAMESLAHASMNRQRRSSRAVVGIEDHVPVPLDARLNNCSAAQLSDVAGAAYFVRPSGDLSPFFGRSVHA
jgi:hypothetical protein